MSEQQEQMSDQQQDQNSDKDQQTPETVTLDTETYQALINHLDELEAKINQSGDDDRDELDELAEEGQQQHHRQQQQREPDLDNLSPREIIDYVTKNLTEQAIMPLAVTLETIRLNTEIDRLTRQKGYEDFWDYKDDIHRIAKDNPKLSLKAVYKLAKSERQERDIDKSEDRKKEGRTDFRRNLPKLQHLGERPSGQGRSATDKSEPLSLKDAAARAFDETVQGGGEE